MSDSVLLPIPYNRIDDVWPQVKDMLESAADSTNGRVLVRDFYQYFTEKDMVLWVSIRDKNIEAIAATEVLQYARKKMCHVRLLTGKDYANWAHLEKGIADWAKSIGCAGMESVARKGWSKVFKDYEQSHVFLERMF